MDDPVAGRCVDCLCERRVKSLIFSFMSHTFVFDGPDWVLLSSACTSGYPLAPSDSATADDTEALMFGSLKNAATWVRKLFAPPI
jgi:hypothetical protein